jgi:hypothetical protein
MGFECSERKLAMDWLERMELSLCITVGVITFVSCIYNLCTLCPGDVVELARLTLL